MFVVAFLLLLALGFHFRELTFGFWSEILNMGESLIRALGLFGVGYCSLSRARMSSCPSG